MHGFSTVDGFVEITECLAEMIKYIANEPSVGLFYVQQHSQNAVPNLITLKNNVLEKSRETTLHTEDLEDSITMVSSMKKCGFPVADEMIRDIKKSLAIISTKQPKRGLIHKVSGFQMGRTNSWGPTTWGHGAVYAQEDKERRGSYISSAFKSAKQKASHFKWPQFDPKESIQTEGEMLLTYPTSTLSVTSATTSSSLLDAEVDSLPLSSQVEDEPLKEGEDTDTNVSVTSHNLLSVPENFNDFKADKEAKLKEWLAGTDNLNQYRDASDAKGL